MKKLFILLSLVFSIALMAQERTVSLSLGVGDSYYLYHGTTSDVLIPTTRDTIDIVIRNPNSAYVKKIAVKSKFDMRTTADTTVSVSVFGKEFYDDTTYVQVIASTTSDTVITNDVIQILTSDPYVTTAAFNIPLWQEITTNIDTLVVPVQTTTEFDKSYRYYRIRYILTGNDHVGTGVILDEMEFKLYF